MCAIVAFAIRKSWGLNFYGHGVKSASFAQPVIGHIMIP